MANPRFIITDELKDIRNEGWRPYGLTKFFVSFLRQYFGDPDNLESEMLQSYPWTANETTGILIEPISKWAPKLTEKRLALIIKRQDQKVLRQGIDDRMMIPSGVERVYATYVQGSHTIFCLGQQSAETEILGAEVYQNLVEFGPAIREYMCLHKFVVVDIGALSLLEEGKQHFVVPINVAYVYEEAWELFEPDAEPLTGVSVVVEEGD